MQQIALCLHSSLVYYSSKVIHENNLPIHFYCIILCGDKGIPNGNCKKKWVGYHTHTIISRGLYIFYPIFHYGLYCRAVSITDKICTEKEILQFLGLKSAVYNRKWVIMASIRNIIYYNAATTYLNTKNVLKMKSINYSYLDGVCITLLMSCNNLHIFFIRIS